MNHIDPSHFVALSFFILICFLVWKRFFNVGLVLDEEINLIKKHIEEAEHARETAYARLKKINADFESVDESIIEIIEKGRVACDALIASIREEITAEIEQKKNAHALHAKHLSERFKKNYQEHLIAEIFKKLKIHLKEQSNEKFYDQQLKQSLTLLNQGKVAA